MAMVGVDTDMDLASVLIPGVRLRRLRHHPQLRELTSEHRLSVKDLVLPLFIKEGIPIRQPIPAMPGHDQISLDQLPEEIKTIERLRIPAVILFGIPNEKNATGSAAIRPDGIIQRAIACIKRETRHVLVIADLCFCEYTDHGHCGMVHRSLTGTWDVDNDQTLEHLVKQAVSLAQAGADVIAPSGMMDGMVRALRNGLDQAGFVQLPILSYAVKYASALYEPFRAAAEGAPQWGDRRSYQMDPAQAHMALREAALDVEEGADLLMVKPGLPYLDIIYRVKQQFPSVPLGAYQVSGEFAMIKAASAQGWLDEKAVMLESLLALKRAGADFIITYFAKQAAEVLR
ncbi:MAG: delta-aminolevulinic acid dehydratase [Coxiella sp. RIFCSPHIGHO2_12_FULL_44_14]|nr:MAG: delta-aminolevulinic acid dehydratase [Coxiella sp. RIFCSPHIGHO2_12_FULL_44_14]